MASAGKLGSPPLRALYSESNKGQTLVPYPPSFRLTWASRTAKQYAGIALPLRLKKPAVACCGPKPSIESPNESEEASEESYSLPASQLIPNAHNVEYLVTELCETTTIGEFKLKLNGFQLHIKRESGQDPQPPSLPSASMNLEELAEAPAQNGSVLATSLAIFKPGVSEENVEELLNSAADKGLELIRSPTVGFFRRSRKTKKKLAPPSCKVGESVMKGKTLCYIRQLGGQFALKSHIAGEVVQFLVEDGDAVGYGDPVIAILPSFPGIKKLR